MKISEIFESKRVTVSFEVFPPKTEAAFTPIISAVDELSSLKPDYMSVTYGAGGGTSANTVAIASHIQNELNVPALSHLTCVSLSRAQTAGMIDKLKANGIENVLALRGDIPEGMDFPEAGYYKYASQLITELRESGGFCVGAACYPEGHIECRNKADDLDYLKEKVDCGVDFLVTQMFFDNNVLYSFLYNALRKSIDIPVTAGIMPLINGKQIARSCQLSGSTLTPKFKAIVDKFGDKPEALRQAGIAYAIDQIVDLVANGVRGIHIYTMNRPETARQIMTDLSEIFR